MAGHTLKLLPGRLAVCRLPARAQPPPAWGDFFCLTHTKQELSLVCAEEDAPPEAQVEDGWRCLEVQGPSPDIPRNLGVRLRQPAICFVTDRARASM